MMADPPVEAAKASAADALEAEVLARISPSPELLDRVHGASERLVQRAVSSARSTGAPLVRALVAGSAARGTFLNDRLDIDLFLLFPPTLDRANLERAGLALAREVLGSSETRYAEHPYLRGTFEGFAVDAVPGYAVDDPAHPLSAVDRTPFHQRYLEARTTPRHAAEIRLTKQFLRGIGAYGSEARTAGFSGYLVELLVLRFGSLRALLEEGRRWRIPVRLPTDPQARPRVPDDVALILDDPVDPHRNVATALSQRNLALFILAARAYLGAPGPIFFEPFRPQPWSLPAAKTELERRGTTVGVLTLPRPELVDDQLYPQLHKAERALASAAARLGFAVVGTASAAGEGLVVLVEVTHGELAAVRPREGPPVGLDRGDSFLEKWGEGAPEVLQGPYVDDGGRLAVETLRTERRLEPLLTAELSALPIGRDLRGVAGARVRSLEEERACPELESALGTLLGKGLPWRRAITPGTGSGRGTRAPASRRTSSG
jgi:tRNA nucleotidyltransferase (CCA-adding enzyme)